MSICSTCKFGLCVTQNVRDVLMLPQCRPAPDAMMGMGQPDPDESWKTLGGDEEEEEEQPLMIEDPSKPPLKHVIEDTRSNSYCFWSPKGPTEEPVIQMQDVTECSRYEKA